MYDNNVYMYLQNRYVYKIMYACKINLGRLLLISHDYMYHCYLVFIHLLFVLFFISVVIVIYLLSITIIQLNANL